MGLSNKNLVAEDFHTVVCWWKHVELTILHIFYFSFEKIHWKLLKKTETTKKNKKQKTKNKKTPSNCSEMKLFKVYTAIWLGSG